MFCYRSLSWSRSLNKTVKLIIKLKFTLDRLMVLYTVKEKISILRINLILRKEERI